MKVAYLDCARGISGGSAFAALLDAGADAGALEARLDVLGWDGSRVVIEDTMVGPFRARVVSIDGGGEVVGHGLADMERLVDDASLPDGAREVAVGVYRRLAEAEAHVHGSTSDAVRFHEIGSLRSFTAVIGAALALDDLGIDRIVSSPVPLGHGSVETAHGSLPVPTPATLELLRGMQVEPHDLEGELVTPTGAAILAAVASGSGPSPPMSIERVGYGTGGPGSDRILTRAIVGEATMLED